MEIRCSAFEKGQEVVLIVEPWGDEFQVPADSFLRLILDGEPIEEMTVDWFKGGVMVWPPRNTVLRVQTEAGQTLRVFDVREIPETPPRQAG